MLATALFSDSVSLSTSILITAGLAILPLSLWFLVGLYNSTAKYPSNIPRYSVAENSHASKSFPTLSAALKEAFPKFREAAFLVTGKRPWVWTKMVVIPPKWVDQLKALPDHQLSFIDAVDDRMNFAALNPTFHDPVNNATVVRAVANDLTRHVAKVMVDLDDELKFAFDKTLPACEDWSEVYPGQVLPQAVAHASGRIFVGLPLSRDAEFLKATITFTVDAFLAGQELGKWPIFLRSYVAPWLKLVKVCKQQHTIMKRLLKGQLEERYAMLREGKELPSDMMTWLIKNSTDKYKFNLDHQAASQLMVSLAAIHTTTMTVAHAWLDLAARPEYLEPLRQELEEVLATEDDGAVSKSSMPKLKKLDSFLKESQRLNPIGPTTFDRKVNSELTLPDGTRLPKGSYITVASSQISMDTSIWENPEEFDGFRFEKLRQKPGNENRYQFATTGVESMNFGHGKHACPGRFFAANEIKLALAYLLKNYDCKLPEGAERPKNIFTPSGNIPDYSKPILLKRRAVEA